MITWKHFVVPRDHVNPLYFTELEQLHRFLHNRAAISEEPDLL